MDVALIRLTIFAFLINTGAGMILPILPLYVRELGGTGLLVGLVFSGVSLTRTLVSPPLGYISDRYGRRITIVLGWLIYGTAYLGFAVATTAWAVILLFVYYGLFYAFTEGVERAFVADLVSAERQGTAYGWYHLMIGLGSLPASLLFGWIWKAVSPSAAFLVGAGLALLAMVLLLTLVKEVPSHPASTSG